MELNRYFFDSYAIIEILDGNQNYAKFSNEPVIITLFNLAEIYWFCINEYEEFKANEIYSKYKQAIMSISDDILKEAMKFRKEHKKQDLSYTDCIGYIFAKKNNLIFLTGDKEFEKMENVEFVK
ncbi:MAG: PIN domain-containing protein [Nanoarchaeota archaeon]